MGTTDGNPQENQTNRLASLVLQQTPQDIDDQTFRDRFREDARRNWRANSEQYHKLLTTYVDNAGENLKLKRFQKKVFFWTSVIILLGVTAAIVYIIYRISKSEPDVTSMLLQVITALTAFLTPLLVLPKTIVNYLFTTKDEEHMLQIIEQIIQHDDSSLEK